MGIFAKLATAQHFSAGKYVSPGLYIVEIKKVKSDKTRQGRMFWVVEMKVLASSNTQAHLVGTDMSWMTMLDQDASFGNIRKFLSVASEIEFEEVGEEQAEYAISEENPLAGIVLKIVAVNIKTRAGKDFTKVEFHQVGIADKDLKNPTALNAILQAEMMAS